MSRFMLLILRRLRAPAKGQSYNAGATGTPDLATTAGRR
ncbi:hypothetical protein AtDm6_0795 [Acetobacter tropicalis]|uniref:Uncharacterized protein n=2 Tax=Acetobacter tropicalis TaxID=104102 RepID=F7VG09_9PROT|nr:hypothetical protein AtDm6_0795 [Acetobacter tropicalis]GAA09304.1 hypothetical protein ATPR_2308 [Acetobacter tropicalis NBRC 101654]